MLRFGGEGAMNALRHLLCPVEWNLLVLSMEPLYPQNIIERTFPHLREQREKAEKESRLNPKADETPKRPIDEGSTNDENLYFDVPYKGGQIGKHLSTFA